MICKHCGKNIKDNSKFCLYCGQKVEVQAAANAGTEKEAQAATNVVPGKEVQVTANAGTEKEVQVVANGGTEKEVQAAANGGSGKEAQVTANGGTGRASQTATATRIRKEESSNEQEAKKKRSKTPIVAAAVVIIVIAVAVGRFFWPKPSQPSNGDGNKNSAESLTPKPNRSDSSASFQASADELLSYVDQAEKLGQKANENADAVFVEYTAEEFRRLAVMSKELLDDYLKLQKQAEAVSGIGTELEKAGKEYFNILCDSQRADYEVCLFVADYMDFYLNMEVARLSIDDYLSESEGYDQLYTWYLSTKEEYSAITSCPPYMEDTWKRYGDALDLNLEIVDRLYKGEAYNDWLREMSAIYLSERYTTVQGLLFNEILDCLDGEGTHVEGQIEAASKLAQEMHAYAKMGEAERAKYEFQGIRTGEVTVSYSAVDTIYPSLYNSYDAFVIIKAGCISGTRRVIVEAEIEGLTQSYKDTITLDSAYREIRIKPPALTGDLDLSLAKNGQIRVTISASDGTWSEEKTFPITIKSKYDFELYNDEYGTATRDNLLCFLTPESMELAKLERQAAVEISNMTAGQMDSFVGYQETGWNHYTGTYLQAAGIMRALNVMGVKYINGAFSLSEGSHQHILFPEDVLQEKGGLCIETTLLVASTLQRAGMHAYILLPPGHAQVAVEIWNGAGDNITGTGEYFLIETTALSDSWNNQDVFVGDANALINLKVRNESPIVYYNADDWYDYIMENQPYIIDCDDSKVFGMMPFTN